MQRSVMHGKGKARHRNAKAKNCAETDEQRIARISGGIAWSCKEMDVN